MLPRVGSSIPIPPPTLMTPLNSDDTRKLVNRMCEEDKKNCVFLFHTFIHSLPIFAGKKYALNIL